MNGIMFYLDRDVPLVHGHAIYIDSEWALTSISQAQFWRERRPRALRRRARRGDPLGRRLGVGAARPAHRQGRVRVHAARRSARRSGASSPTTSTTAAPVLDDANVLALVPRPRDRVPEPDRGDEPRAAADQHRRLVGRPARTPRRGSRTCSSPPTSCARTPTSRRWRAPTRPRGGRSTRSSTRPARAPRCDVWKLREPAFFGPRAAARPVRWRLFRRPARSRRCGRGRRRAGADGPLARAVLGAGALSAAAAR